MLEISAVISSTISIRYGFINWGYNILYHMIWYDNDPISVIINVGQQPNMGFAFSLLSIISCLGLRLHCLFKACLHPLFHKWALSLKAVRCGDISCEFLSSAHHEHVCIKVLIFIPNLRLLYDISSKHHHDIARCFRISDHVSNISSLVFEALL